MFQSPVPPLEKQLRRSDTFTFACHGALACFNQCCRERHLPLTPYDVLRLRAALGTHSDDFLTRYTAYRLDPISGFPIVLLDMQSSAENQCPFVSHAGCRVYEDRPTACRLFPLGRVAGMGRGNKDLEECFYLLDTPMCLGKGEDQAWTIAQWLNDQALKPYLEANDKMHSVVFHPHRDRGKPLNERQLQKVFVACYSLDVFRDFTLKSDFFRKHKAYERLRPQILEDDQILLNLGLDYLYKTLFRS
jgi:Fe-S-cluster containining protein